MLFQQRGLFGDVQDKQCGPTGSRYVRRNSWQRRSSVCFTHFHKKSCLSSAVGSWKITLNTAKEFYRLLLLQLYFNFNVFERFFLTKLVFLKHLCDRFLTQMDWFSDFKKLQIRRTQNPQTLAEFVRESNQSWKHSLNITKKTTSKKQLLPSSKSHCQCVSKKLQLKTK